MNEYSRTSKAVHMVSRILSIFSVEKEEIGVREVSKIIPEMSPPSIYRLMSSMEACGLLERNASRKYRLGDGVFEIGVLFPLHSSLRKIVRPHAEDLAKTFRTNVQLAIPRKMRPDSAIILDRITSLDDPLFHGINYHLNMPLHCTALGKCILAFMSEEERQEILPNIVLTRHTKNTITDINVLANEIDQIQKHGFSVDREEILENLYCVAAPLFQMNRLVGALSLADTTGRISKKNLDEIGKALKERTIFISRQLLGAK